MNIEAMDRAGRGDEEQIARRVAAHAALADPARLRIVDLLGLGDASSSELAATLGMPSNLLAHHTGVLQAAGLVAHRRSDADRRRSYLTLVPEGLPAPISSPMLVVRRVLFVCTANTARSQLAAALWRSRSRIPATSAGTHPAQQVDPGAVRAAERHQLRLPRRRPRRLDQVQQDHDFIITVCDKAHEELAGSDGLHWSLRDPVLIGTAAEFDHTVTELAERIGQLAPRLQRVGQQPESRRTR